MNLLLKWTTGGALWGIGRELCYAYEIPERLNRLRRIIDDWYHRCPSEPEFVEDFDREGYLLAPEIQRETGHHVVYSPLEESVTEARLRVEDSGFAQGRPRPARAD